MSFEILQPLKPLEDLTLDELESLMSILRGKAEQNKKSVRPIFRDYSRLQSVYTSRFSDAQITQMGLDSLLRNRKEQIANASARGKDPARTAFELIGTSGSGGLPIDYWTDSRGILFKPRDGREIRVSWKKAADYALSEHPSVMVNGNLGQQVQMFNGR